MSTRLTTVRTLWLSLAAALALAVLSVPATSAAPASDVTPVEDAEALLGACADQLGVELTYARTGGINAVVARTLPAPRHVKRAMRAAASGQVEADVTAVYGLTEDPAVQVVIEGDGAASGDQGEIDIDDGSLCYLGFRTDDDLPADAEAALATLKATFPGVPQRAPYQTTELPNGGYAFYIAAPGGEDEGGQALVLTARPLPRAGGTMLSATAGSGAVAVEQ